MEQRFYLNKESLILLETLDNKETLLSNYLLQLFFTISNKHGKILDEHYRSRNNINQHLHIKYVQEVF